MTYPVCALVLGDEVKEVIVGEYTEASRAATMKYGRRAFAVDVSQNIEVAVVVGDKYENGVFKRLTASGEWEIVPQNLSEKARIETLESTTDDVMIALAELYEMIVGE